jgi:hypothetical protein
MVRHVVRVCALNGFSCYSSSAEGVPFLDPNIFDPLYFSPPILFQTGVCRGRALGATPLPRGKERKHFATVGWRRDNSDQGDC